MSDTYLYSSSMQIDPKDLALLVRDKYEGKHSKELVQDVLRLEAGEPLAYVIGWMPFLGLKLRLDSHPLIPRPETEWWTEVLIAHLLTKEPPLTVLDLCAGSGAIGLAILPTCKHAHVSFAELSPLHSALIALNADENHIDKTRMTIRSGDLFTPYEGERFSVIASNPPYIPSSRSLDESVLLYEPTDALYSGEDGLDIIRRIIAEAPEHLLPNGELWMECDIENIDAASALMKERGFTAVEIRTDLYGRPRVCVGYFS